MVKRAGGWSRRSSCSTTTIRTATETHLHAVGDRLLEAFGDHPPYAVFSDSLEDYGSNWTGDLLEQFRQRRGYDLTPHLPALVADAGPETRRGPP